MRNVSDKIVEKIKTHILWSITFPYVPSASITFFRHYLTNGKIFGEKKVVKHKTYIFISSIILSETFLILRIIQRGIVINVHRFNVMYPLFSSDIKEIWIFSTAFFFKKNSNVKFHKHRSRWSRVPCGQTDGRKDGQTWRN